MVSIRWRNVLAVAAVIGAVVLFSQLRNEMAEIASSMRGILIGLTQIERRRIGLIVFVVVLGGVLIAMRRAIEGSNR